MLNTRLAHICLPLVALAMGLGPACGQDIGRVSAAPLDISPRPGASASAARPRKPAKPRGGQKKPQFVAKEAKPQAVLRDPPHPPVEKPASPDSDEALARIAKTYCSINNAAAADARIARQTAELRQAEQRVIDRTRELESRIADLREWTRRREKMLQRASEDLVTMYRKVKPDAAAAQLSAMEEDLAISILLRLDPRGASAILGEMSPDKAAALVRLLGARRSDAKAG